MPQVRLWTWWDGPQGPVPPGEIVRVSADDAGALTSSGMGELVDEGVDLAVAGPPERAISRRGRRRKAA